MSRASRSVWLWLVVLASLVGMVRGQSKTVHDPQLLEKIYSGKFDTIGDDATARMDVFSAAQAFADADVKLDPPIGDPKGKLPYQPAQVKRAVFLYSQPAVAGGLVMIFLSGDNQGYKLHPGYLEAVTAIGAHREHDPQWEQTVHTNLLKLIVERSGVLTEPKDRPFDMGDVQADPIAALKELAKAPPQADHPEFTPEMPNPPLIEQHIADVLSPYNPPDWKRRHESDDVIDKSMKQVDASGAKILWATYGPRYQGGGRYQVGFWYQKVGAPFNELGAVSPNNPLLELGDAVVTTAPPDFIAAAKVHDAGYANVNSLYMRKTWLLPTTPRPQAVANPPLMSQKIKSLLEEPLDEQTAVNVRTFPSVKPKVKELDDQGAKILVCEYGPLMTDGTGRRQVVFWYDKPAISMKNARATDLGWLGAMGDGGLTEAPADLQSAKAKLDEFTNSDYAVYSQARRRDQANAERQPDLEKKALADQQAAQAKLDEQMRQRREQHDAAVAVAGKLLSQRLVSVADADALPLKRVQASRLQAVEDQIKQLDAGGAKVLVCTYHSQIPGRETETVLFWYGDVPVLRSAIPGASPLTQLGNLALSVAPATLQEATQKHKAALSAKQKIIEAPPATAPSTQVSNP